MAENTTQSQPDTQGGKSTTENSTQHQLVEDYSGPSVHDMISTHTLAENVIKYNTQLLDEDNMALLKRFVNDPDSRDQILSEIHIEDVDGVTGQYHGSLAGFIIMKHKSEVGETVEPVLTDGEIERLKEWFDSRDSSAGLHGSSHSHRHRHSHGRASDSSHTRKES